MTDKPVDFSILANANAPVRTFKAGEVIFREGDPAEELFVIKSGKVGITLVTGCSTPCRSSAFSARWP